MDDHPSIAGEVVAVNTREITGQLWRGRRPPGYGTFVRIGEALRAVGVVHNIETLSLDASRRPMALERREAEIPRAFPQLPGLVRVQFQALLIGQYEGDRFRFGVPGTPPPLHAEIRGCLDGEIREIARDLGFFRFLLDAGSVNAEELILRTCHCVLEAHGHRREEAVRAGRALSDVFRDDYDALRRVMIRLEAWLNE